MNIRYSGIILLVFLFFSCRHEESQKISEIIKTDDGFQLSV